jgi:hypothetical protein
MTSVENESKAVEPQGRYMCAGATWAEIPAMCLEGGSGREVRYASAPAVDQVASDIADRFNVAFEWARLPPAPPLRSENSALRKKLNPRGFCDAHVG